MAEEIKRYEIEPFTLGDGRPHALVRESDAGEWVRYADAAALDEENAKLRERIERLRFLVHRFAPTLKVYQGEVCAAKCIHVTCALLREAEQALATEPDPALPGNASEPQPFDSRDLEICPFCRSNCGDSCEQSKPALPGNVEER